MLKDSYTIEVELEEGTWCARCEGIGLEGDDVVAGQGESFKEACEVIGDLVQLHEEGCESLKTESERNG